MVKNAQNNKLGFLGEDFQCKLVHAFVEDKEFFKDLCDIVDQNLFTDPNLKTLVGVMREYYKKRQSVPNYDTIKVLLAEKSHNATEKEFYDAFVDKIHKTGKGDVNDYDKCVELLNKALTQGINEDLGYGVFDNENETLSEDYRIAIPTGIKKIDETLEGGLGKGELGVIVGSSSFGKTSLTTAMASHAATYSCPQNNNDGYKVLQIVFEDRVKQIQRKHFGRITGIEAKDLSKPAYIDLVRQQLEKYEDRETLQKNLRIIRLPSGEKTADDIKRLIIKLKNNGFSPDLVIVDYFECLLCKGESSDDKWEKEGKTMRKFEAMAGELNIALWIPVQGTKDSLNAEVVTMDKAGGSFKKIQIAHIVMSIARTVEDIEQSLATIAILKNRAGQAGKVLNGVSFNNGTCRISTDNVEEYNSMFAMKEKKNQDITDAAKELMIDLQKNKK